MGDAFDLVQNFLGEVFNMTPAAGNDLAPTERQEEIKRRVPFQPRVPVTVEVAAQAERDDEARERALRKEAWLQWRSDEHAATQAQQGASGVGTDAFYEANTQGADAKYPGALNSRAADYATKVMGANKAQQRLDDAALSGEPFNQTI